MKEKKKAPLLREHRGDVQAVVASGFGWLHASRFRLMTIEDLGLALQWLEALQRSGLVRSVKDVGGLRNSADPDDHLAAIAFSHAGLRALGFDDSPEFPFPTAFRSGMGSALREDLLRDQPRDQWLWGDQAGQGGHASARQVVHILFGHWWRDGAEWTFPPIPQGAFRIREVHGDPGFFRGEDLYEPFGFRDGISQPVIYGLKEDVDRGPEDPLAQDHVVAPGEFILGYRNEYDELSYCPHMVRPKHALRATAWAGNLGFNGSYLAVRETNQDMEALKRLDEIVMPRSSFPAGVCPAEKMMGRHRDGRPLGWPQGRPLTDQEANAFRYRVEDEGGFVTPRGSHIRRANPRDMLGHDVESGILSSKLHRLLRRGRPYRGDGGKPVGLFFIACNTDLERQFEFIYQRWMRNPRFADLEDQDDPMLGATGPDRRFSIPCLPAGEPIAFQSLTTTVGGGYFFLPGLGALSTIAQR